MGENTLNGAKESTQFQKDLLKFPPILRKLALQALQADDIYNIKELASQAGISAKDCYHMIYLQRKKGNDFYGFIKDVFRKQLEPYRSRVNKKLIKEVLKGSYRHMELYYRLVGDLRPEPRTGPDTVNNSLTFVLQMPDSLPDKLGTPKAEPLDITPDSEE